MPKEAPEIRLIRETLEGVLHPSTASTVFFEAISASEGKLPTNAEEALALVRGPVRTALAERLGDSEAESTIEGLERMLAAIQGQPAAPPSRSEEVTRNLEISSEVLPVYVLSASTRLTEQLRAVVGPDVMSALTVTDSDTFRTRIAQVPPGFVLIDASEFAAIEPAEVADMLGSIPKEIVKALWGADLPYGQSVLAEAQTRGLRLTPFDRREGVEPLIDVIRSRHAGG